MSIPISLPPRDIAAAARITCSDVSLDVRIGYGALPDDRTPMQRLIEQRMAPPDDARRVLVGDLEFYFRDGIHLTGISLYHNFAALAGTALIAHWPAAPAVWLQFPDFTASDRDIIRYESPVRVSVDRASRTIRLVVDESDECDMFILADGLWVGRTRLGSLGAIILSGVDWI